jgi:hypothetical protein
VSAAEEQRDERAEVGNVRRVGDVDPDTHPVRR